MSLTCGACLEPLPTDGKIMKCSECFSQYHLGQRCSHIAESTFKTMGKPKRKIWVCGQCRETKKQLSFIDTDSELVSQDDSGALSAQLVAVNKKLDLLYNLKESVDRLSELPTNVEGLLSMKPTVEALKETVGAVQASITFLSEQYDAILTRVSSNDNEVKLLRSEVSSLQTTVSEQALAIQQLQSSLNDKEQDTRQSNMEIHGILCSPHEDLFAVLKDLSVKLNIPQCHAGEILGVHRFRARPNSIPPILVQFVSTEAKQKWMSFRRKLGLLSGDQQKIYFNENLTKANKELFWQARTKGKERGYSFVWVKNGIIFAKKAEGTAPVRISGAGDLDKIV